MSNGSSANWKEQLGIVSGNILVTGLALTQLWPTVANYQTGVHTHAWNLTWSLHQIKPDYVVYWYLEERLRLLGKENFSFADRRRPLSVNWRCKTSDTGNTQLTFRAQNYRRETTGWCGSTRTRR